MMEITADFCENLKIIQNFYKTEYKKILENYKKECWNLYINVLPEFENGICSFIEQRDDLFDINYLIEFTRFIRKYSRYFSCYHDLIHKGEFICDSPKIVYSSYLAGDYMLQTANKAVLEVFSKRITFIENAYIFTQMNLL